MTRDLLLDRVHKLLALAGSDNVHEAAAAASRAQALITAHRLEDWLTDDGSALDPITDAQDDPLETFRKLRRWKTVLASELAHINGCVAYTLQREHDQALVLIGRQRDRDAVRALYEPLVVRIEWLSATHGPKRSRRWHDSFRIGAVHTLAQRLADDDVPAPSTEALAVLKPAMQAHQHQLDAVVADRLGPARGRRISVDADAWEHGRQVSSSLILDP